jgi:hypothetical protein
MSRPLANAPRLGVALGRPGPKVSGINPPACNHSFMKIQRLSVFYCASWGSRRFAATFPD